MNYYIRTMTRSEHTDNSWERYVNSYELSKSPKNYCIVLSNGRILDDQLTHEEAVNLVIEYKFQDEQDEERWNNENT